MQLAHWPFIKVSKKTFINSVGIMEVAVTLYSNVINVDSIENMLPKIH